ncbi:hypothetical protein TEA_027196 [Camellia sinensis var. sinensis]|uniref:Uncharacterized protein n=1 Tax=Camellia sinensis var. sinensis TaxID=542762 RepID=A0A4S4E8Z7_CAMSN|nr:hypothetical protein TEA_027196 [Camellia sinensis var. sinensis]
MAMPEFMKLQQKRLICALEKFNAPVYCVPNCISVVPNVFQFVVFIIFRSPILSAAVSSVVGLLGLLPTRASRFLVTKSVGKSWSTTAVDALCTHVLQALSKIRTEGAAVFEFLVLHSFDFYHVIRNVLFLAMTEFKKLSETPDWTFMRGKQSRIAFLFGVGDHWGPLQMFDEYAVNLTLPVAVHLTAQHTQSDLQLSPSCLNSVYFVTTNLSFKLTRVSGLTSFQTGLLKLLGQWALASSHAYESFPLALLHSLAQWSASMVENKLISKNVPDVALAIEREGLSHAFSCTKAGSLWVAQHVASLIKNWKTSSS